MPDTASTPSDLRALGYAGVAKGSTEDWAQFAERILGLQIGERSSRTLSLRMDERASRFIIDEREPEPFFGWEVADTDALARVAARLEAAGTQVELGNAALLAQRQVTELIRFQDPAGNHLEVFHGAARAEVDFVPSRAISGFRTGDLGMGHVAITCTSIDELLPFYRDLLGFRLSDFALRPFKAFFFHLNSRHHSFALVETGKRGVHHIMMELGMLDDVGQGYDLALGLEEKVGTSLGRHSNDYMTSFYVWSPADILIEYGWGGRNIDPATWQADELRFGPSLWGHERSWLTPERRADARDLRLALAASGERKPVQVLPSTFELMSN